MSFDCATFYATLRRGTLFDHGLSQRQVQSTEAPTPAPTTSKKP